MLSKKIVGKLISISIITSLLLLILIGKNGLWVWADLKSQIRALQNELKELELQKGKLSEEINNLQNDFYIEQIAREQLQMAYPDDHIYLDTDKKR